MEFENVDSIRNALQSTKITSRKQACCDLFEILTEKKLNIETTEQWNQLYNAIKECMLKDNEKILDEQKKKKLPSPRLLHSADLFKLFLRNHLKKQTVATCTNVFNFLLDSIADPSKVLLKLTLLKILSESLLSNNRFTSSLKERDWSKLYQTLKQLCEKDTSDCEQIKCLTLVLKEGTIYKFPLTLFQQQFPFITKLCQRVNSKSPKPLQESVLALMVMFCKKAAKDNRRSCCKLGEDTFQNLLEIYQDSSEETKITLYDFFLLQTNLHNPKGIQRNHVAAFAISESNWLVYLKGLYQILMYQLKSSLNLSFKDKSIFVCVNEKYYLHHTFLQLFIEICKQLFENENDECEEPQIKRRKNEINVANLISNFQESKSWVWLTIIYNLIETYPQLFIRDDYITLLKIITPLFSESKDEVLMLHIQKALIVLLETHNFETSDNSLWKNVTDRVSQILNQNEAPTHELFQLLIQKKHVTSFDLNFSTDGAPLYSHNLKTLEVAFAHFPFLQYDKSIKKDTIKWLIKKFPDCHSELAKLLLYLTLKDFPKIEQKKKILQRPYEDIENLYLTVCFDSLLTEFQGQEENAQSFYADQSLLDVLLEELYNFLDFEGMTKLKKLFSMVTFVFQCLCLLYENELIDGDNLPLAGIFKHRFRFIFDSCVTVGVPTDEKGKMLELLQWISSLLSITCSQDLCEVHEMISENFIRDLFGILSFALTDDILLKKEAMKILVSFCCIPGNQYLPIQDKALSALVRFKYNFDKSGDYDIVIALLENLKSLSPDLLPDNSLLRVFNLVQQICESYFYCNETILLVLDFLYAIYPTVHSSNCGDAKNQFVVLLYPIFVKRHAYSALISMKLLRCVHLLYENEPTKPFLWNNENIIVHITEFLKDNQQEIRFEAIKVLADFFQQSSKIRSLTHFHLQEITFSKLSEMSYLALQVEVNSNDQTKLIDDIVSRSSSIIHTFVSIIVSSHNWVEESLFKLIRITCDKNLDLRQVQLAIERASQILGFTSGLSFLKKYLLGLINRWKSFDFDTFPFQLYNCNSKFDLYKNYWDQIFYIFIENEENNIREVASLLGKTVQELIKEVYPRLFSCCLAQEITDLSLDNLKKNKIYRFLSKTEENLTECIEKSILGLMEYVNDENDFRTFYGEFIIFPKSNDIVLTVEDFKRGLIFIQGYFYENACLISHLLHKKPHKIHLILSQLNYNISKLQALEEQLRYFHLYTIFSLLCVSKLEGEPRMQTYLVRDLTHTLLHHIKNHNKRPELAKASCKLLKSVLEKLLPSLSTVVSNFFLVIVSRLKFVALEHCSVSEFCVQMLEFMIVEHQDLFQSEIQKLASVPNTPQFSRIYKVHFKLKYSERTVTLEDEIAQFLEFCNNMESLDECKDSVSHLRNLLIDKKQDMGDLFKKLQKTMGSSEDCEKSVLHKLVYTLIKLCFSPNERMSLEAAKCLGEIGAADLATLILQPEKPIPDPKWTPFELLLTETLTLLLKYIVDADVAVSKVASAALFQVMFTKEGRKAGDIGGHRDYLVPFFGTELRSVSFVFNVDGDSFVDFVQDDNLWIPRNNCHESWVRNLVCALLRSCTNQDFFRSFVDVCALKVEFSEQILPILIYCILYLNNFVFTNVISSQIATFFEQHWSISVDGAENDSITMNKAAVKCMLDVVHFVRLQKSVRRKDVKDLKLDYLKMAKAAHFCDAHFTALLYSELWCQEQVNLTPNDFALSSCTYTKLDLIYKKVESKQRNTLQSILRQAYKSVGETDALLGCGTFHLLDPRTRVEHYKESNNWDQVIRHYEREVSIGRNLSLRPLVDSLCNSNLYQLAQFCPEEKTSYECLWKLGQWESKYDACAEEVYDRCQFFALKAVHENEVMSIHKFLQDGRKCVMKEFKSANMESIKNFYDCFVKLQCLNEIEEVLSEPINNLLSKWKLQDDICRNYDYLEPVHVQRTVLLQEVLKYDGNSQFKDAIFDAMIDYSDYARIEGKTHVAARILNNLRFLEPSSDFVARIQLEEAQLCLSIHDDITAKCLLQHLCTSEEINPRLHAMALKMTGNWMVESSSENRETIIENYFQKSLKIMKNIRSSIEDEKIMIDTFYQLAKFTDQEYQDIMTHIKSDIFQKKKQNIIKARESVSKINVKKVTKDLQKAVAIRTKQSCIDEIEINNIETEKNNLLTLALKYYLLTLRHSGDHNMAIFRLFSLLLENPNNPIVESVLKEEFKKIPTYTFINILPQIVPHIAGDNDTFMTAVNSLIIACAKDHPYHTLPLILALALSNKDREYAESKSVVNDVRTHAAKQILNELKQDRKLGTLIKKMTEMSEALIELAYHTPDSSTKLPRKAKLRGIKNFDDVLLPTVTLPVNKGRDYSHIVGICHFGDSFQNVGGINAPKRITCLGTDGVVRSQLVKGQDDLRQDAVMQQVFTIMNDLLAVNKQTSNLRIRTYKIVPLSMRSGILEWVDNTMPIGEYLTGGGGNDGAHVKFRPADATPNKCRIEFKNISSKSNEEKLKCFNKICEKIKPVFHKFFETSFPQPTVWYEKRRSYVHSVATSSMCGYILGIGDRHVNNILIDKSTAEVVHIDFGIAFEQGRVLPTPETVPFRLTRDIVDGMGVAGVEGLFRRSCERTMEVLRANHQTIITILEVLLYDPLYDWTVSNAEANKRQKDEQDDSVFEISVGGGSEAPFKNVNETAERALLRLKSKLCGTENGKSTTVEHQVRTLIQQAVDPSNLSKLFYGWQPYL